MTKDINEISEGIWWNALQCMQLLFSVINPVLSLPVQPILQQSIHLSVVSSFQNRILLIMFHQNLLDFLSCLIC